MSAVSTVSTLRSLFSRKIKESGATDSDLAALARLILLESKSTGKNGGSSFVGDAEQANKDTAIVAKEALGLLSVWDEGDTPMPKTFRILIDPLLKGWVNSFIDMKLEKELVDALLALDELDDKEKGQLEEALRVCAKEHLRYQPDKLLRIVSGATDESNETVVHWAFKRLTSAASFDHLRFAAICLQACGEGKDNATELEEAAKYHIEAAAKTLSVAEKMRFADVPGGLSKLMDGTLWLRTSSLVDYMWVTSNMGEKTKKESVNYANAWLDAAEKQVVEQLGPQEKRGFDVNLVVTIYPHEKDWYRRRDELEVLEAVSRTV